MSRFLWLMGSSSNASASRPVVTAASSDVAIKDSSCDEDDGYGNAGLEIASEFVEVANREVINRELVNLENAAVNIDNSNDVIIGPVTQFNVNGNVTIYQNKDGRTVGLEGKPDRSDDVSNEFDNFWKPSDVKPAASSEKKQIRRRQCLVWACCLTIVILTVASAVKVILIASDKQTISNYDDTTPLCVCPPTFIERAEWGGRAPTERHNFSRAVRYVIIKHTGGNFCETRSFCEFETLKLQMKHMSMNYSDIGYNFLVGGDGNVYVGRGYFYRNENLSESIDIAVHGNFYYDQYYRYMIEATKAIIDYGLEHSLIVDDYSVLCHNQTDRNTISPGRNVFKEVIKWSDYHYDENTYFNKCF